MYLGTDAKTVLLMGINKVADFVATTMGPGGKYITITRGHQNHITKDGVTVAKHFVVPDKAEQVGVDFIINAAKKALYEAGDGTTTTTVMARAMMLDAHQRLALKRLNTQRISKEMLAFSEKAIKAIEAQAIKAIVGTDEGDALLLQVGVIASNGDDQMADMCLKAIKKVGADHTNITFQEAEYDDADSIVFKRGMVIPSRVGGEMLGPYNRRTIKRLSDTGKVAVIVAKTLDNEISLTREFKNMLQAINKHGHGVLLVCKEPADNLKSVFINDSERMQCAYISPTLHGSKYIQMAEDIMILTGATLLNPDRQEDDPLPDLYMGYCESVDITRDGMTLINTDREGSPEHELLVENVKEMIATETHRNNRAMLKERLARLSTGVASIRVTGDGSNDLVERKDRYDDCVRAICTAINTGVVRGGGAAYLSAAYQLLSEEVDPLDQERKIARDLIEAALITPFNTITMNTLNYIPRINGKRLVKETDLTVDVWTGEFISAYEHGILDPLGVQCAAIRAAVKATSVFLNTGGMYAGLNVII